MNRYQSDVKDMEETISEMTEEIYKRDKFMADVYIKTSSFDLGEVGSYFSFIESFKGVVFDYAERFKLLPNNGSSET